MPTPLPQISDADKIALIGLLIERQRVADKTAGRPSDSMTLLTLRAIAADMQARRPARARDTRHAIGEKIAALAKAGDVPFGYQSGKLIAIGQEVVGRWRTIEAALELYGLDLPESAPGLEQTTG